MAHRSRNFWLEISIPTKNILQLATYMFSNWYVTSTVTPQTELLVTKSFTALKVITNSVGGAMQFFLNLERTEFLTKIVQRIGKSQSGFSMKMTNMWRFLSLSNKSMYLRFYYPHLTPQTRNFWVLSRIKQLRNILNKSSPVSATFRE